MIRKYGDAQRRWHESTIRATSDRLNESTIVGITLVTQNIGVTPLCLILWHTRCSVYHL